MSDKNRQKPPGRNMVGGPMGFISAADGQKPKNFKKSFKRLLSYLKPYKAKLIAVLIFAILSTSFAIAAPKVMSRAVNALQEGYMAKLLIENITRTQYLVDELDLQGETFEELKSYPKLDTIDDAETKAEISKAYIDFFKDMPPGSIPEEEGQGLDISYTDEQIEGVLQAVRETNGTIDYSYIAFIIMILIAIYLISSTFNLLMNLLMVTVSQNTVRELRTDVDEKLAKLPLKYFDSHSHGDILSRVINDIDTISNTLQQSLVQVITSTITIIGYIIMMLTISPILTLIVIATLPLYLISTLIIVKRSQKYFKAQQKELGGLSGHVEEMYAGHKIIKAFSREKDSIKKFTDINVRLEDAGWRAQFVSGIMLPLMHFISNLGYVLISIVGGIWMTRQILGIGDVLAFIQYSRSFSMPIIQTANIANILQSTIACAERVFEILDEEEISSEENAVIFTGKPKGEVVFDSVSFRYLEDSPLIEDMDLNVEKGHTIAIVGPTGAGKTTLVNLMMRFYEIDKGKILVDGIDIRDLKRSTLRKMFGMVLQDTWLFSGTIKDNIAYGRQDARMDEIISAAKSAHADHFIRTLPKGYDSMLNEEASNISQGQKQLLTIARAILADPPIMILDEATSSVDTRTELLIQNAMMKMMKDKTSFVIAHRLSTIREAETILVMDHGRIIETGAHQELLDKKGFYYDLYMSQFKGEETA